MNTSQSLIVICGVTGDLSHIKLVPALQHLKKVGQLKDVPAIIGTGRKPLSREEFLGKFPKDDDFTPDFHYHQGIPGLREFINKNWQVENIVFFLALPPNTYASTVDELYCEGFRNEARIIIEKPFGVDHNSAQELNNHILECYKEDQIYRIDHYLAKEAIQNILVFRFTNTLFQPIWNNRYITSIHINATETAGIRDRGPYFDSAGIVRDMVQNHLTQLLCLLTMDAPATLSADDIRAEKLSILKSLKVEKSCHFQYEGYREETGVAPDSTTETFSEIQLSINNFKWHGVPVYIRTGKAASRDGIEIGINFKKQPPILFNKDNNLHRNRIIFKVQPSAGIIIDMTNKIPGGDFKITNANMAFCYRDLYSSKIPDAYLKLLLDVIHGDRTLFVSAEETEMAWKIYEPVLDTGKINTYPKGTDPECCFVEDWIDFSKYKDFCNEDSINE